MDDIQPVLTIDTAKFRFQGQKLLLTYPTHLDKKWTTEAIATELKFEPKFLRIAHETGDSNGVPYPHSHVLIDFGKAWQCRDPRRFDIGVLHPNWRPLKTPTHWANAVQYIAKEDPANADLKSVSITRGVWNCSSKADALLQFVTKPADAPGILALYNCKPQATPDCFAPTRPWQAEALKLVESPPNSRQVHWFYDPIGNTGKTAFMRYLGINKLAAGLKMVGSARDFATIMTNMVAEGWNQQCVVFDVPRESEEYGALYTNIETVKDGVITSTKYSGRTEYFRIPHVLVMANFLPNRKKLSKDRWRVHHISQAFTLAKPIFRDHDDEDKDDVPTSTPPLSPAGSELSPGAHASHLAFVEYSAERASSSTSSSGATSASRSVTGGFNIIIPPEEDTCYTPRADNVDTSVDALLRDFE